MTSPCTSCMNSLNQVGVTREGVQRHCRVGPEERGHMILLPLQSGKSEPGQGFLRSRRTRSIGLSSGQYGGENTKRTFSGRVSRCGVWALRLSSSRRFRLSGNACAKRSTKRLNISASDRAAPGSSAPPSSARRRRRHRTTQRHVARA
jgi:hypothetical protein